MTQRPSRCCLSWGKPTWIILIVSLTYSRMKSRDLCINWGDLMIYLRRKRSSSQFAVTRKYLLYFPVWSVASSYQHPWYTTDKHYLYINLLNKFADLVFSYGFYIFWASMNYVNVGVWPKAAWVHHRYGSAPRNTMSWLAGVNNEWLERWHRQKQTQIIWNRNCCKGYSKSV